MSLIYINTDGGSRGNPGPAAIGVVFFDENESIIHSCKQTIGIATNNQAEYRAIIKALEVLTKSAWFNNYNGNGAKVICRLDSELVVKQINGQYKVKNEDIKVYIKNIAEILANIKLKISFTHIPREQNKQADKLVNEALDEKG